VITLKDLSWSKYSWTEIYKIWGSWATLFPGASRPTPWYLNILHIATKSNDLELMKKILQTEEGIDINEQDWDGWTALHIATMVGNLDMVRFLCEERLANPKIKTRYQETSIDFAVGFRDIDITKYFLEIGEKMPPNALTILLGNREPWEINHETEAMRRTTIDEFLKEMNITPPSSDTNERDVIGDNL
jgi:Ankyrin repeats (3 copies)